MQLSVTDSVTHQDLDEMRLGLNAFNSRFIDINEMKAIGVFIKDGAGKSWRD
ncbi:GCN5-like N-acetyltransferase [Plautia stali symbiont]|nr:GCN5-like N-acetyltransferase [Plautia stali symbiont]